MNKTWLAVLAGAMIIAGAGFGINQIFAGKGNPALTVEEVSKKVEERYPGTVKEIELNDKGTRQVYEIELEGPGRNYNIVMDANDGKILKVKQGQHAGDQAKTDQIQDNATSGDRQVKNEPKQEQQRISLEQAEEIALNKFGGKIRDIELGEDDGRWIYEVEMQNGKQEAEIEIDAYTGEILFLSVENDD